MRGFEKLRERAIDKVEHTLDHRPDLEPAEIADLLDDATLPGFLAFLGWGSGGAGDGGSVGREFLLSVARPPGQGGAAGGAGVNSADVERLLAEVLVSRHQPPGPASDDDMRRMVWNVAVAALERETGIELDDQQRQQVLELLTSGQFFADAARSVAAVLHAVPGMPLAMVGDIAGSPYRVARLTVAVLHDLGGVPGSAYAVVTDLLADGDLDQHPAVMVHTLAALFRFATVKSVAATLGELVRPENKSVRLAIVVYARANGIPLKESDLDVLRDTLLSGQDPDLGPLLVLAAQRMVDEKGAAHLKKVLAHLGTSPIG